MVSQHEIKDASKLKIFIKIETIHGTKKLFKILLPNIQNIEKILYQKSEIFLYGVKADMSIFSEFGFSFKYKNQSTKIFFHNRATSSHEHNKHLLLIVLHLFQMFHV